MTTKKPPPPEVTDDKIAQWTAHVNRMARLEQPYAVDLDKLEKRIRSIEDRTPKPPPIIDSVETTKKHQQHIRKLCHLRTQLTQIQTRVIQAKTIWGQILKVTKSYLWSQPEVAALKNDTARGEILRKVAGKLDWTYARACGVIEISDKLIWMLKDNQYGVQSMIAVATEERFLYQQGMEK